MRIIPRRTLAEYGPTDNIIQTTFVYQPGGIAKYNIYNDWSRLATDVELVDGPKIVQIDDSIVSPAPIPAGIYDFKDVTLVGSSEERDAPPVMRLLDDAVFMYLEKISFLEIEGDATSPSFLATDSSQIILQDVILSVLSGASEIFASNSTFDLVLDRTVIKGSNPVISVIDGTTNIWMLNHNRILQDTISAEADTTVNFYLVDPNNYFESQAFILGTFSIIKKSEAEQVHIVDAGTYYVSENVEDALQEIWQRRGQPDGFASLDHLGLVPLEQLPTPFPLNFKGFWDANTNTPDIDFAPVQGDSWIVNVAGTTNLDGINDWQVGDWAIYNGSVWYKLDNSNFVLSVNGYTGDVTLTKSDIGLSNVENTALSTWPGTTNITTLGNITTGTWSGSTIAIDHGGTGLSTTPSNGQLLIGNGTGYTLNTLTDGTGVNITEGSGSITIENTGTLTVGATAPIASSGGQNPDISLNNSGIIAGSYGTASSVPTIAFTEKGLATSASNTPIAIDASQITTGILPVVRGGTGLSASGASGNILISNGTDFTSQTVSQDLSLTSAGVATVTGIYGTPVAATPPALNSVLQYNGAQWESTNITAVLQSSYQTVLAAEPIATGQVVYAVNSNGQYPAARLARANSITTVEGTFGLAIAPIANNNLGTIITLGTLGGLDTQGFVQGAPLYVSPTIAGALTDIKPQGPDWAVQVGLCIRQNNTQGVVYVSPMFATSIENLGDVIVSGAVENDKLIYQASSQTWRTGPDLRIANTQTSVTLLNGGQITAANFLNVIYLPIKTQGGANITLNANPIASLNNTTDYGRILMLRNVDNNRTITFPAGGNTKLDGGVNLTLPPNGMVQFIWTAIGNTSSWLQYSKVVVSS